MHFTDLTHTKAFPKLTETPPVDIRSALLPDRIASASVPCGSGLTYHWATMPVDSRHLKLLQELADEQEVIEKYRALLAGHIMNTGENRMVLHHLTRGSVLGKKAPVIADEVDKGQFYREQLERVRTFSQKIRSGSLKSSTEKTFTTVVQIGIGGSDLGPRALYLALEGWAVAEQVNRIEARFISNVDPDDASQVLAGLDLERTLFILVSKSGTTQETLTNYHFVRQAIENSGIAGIDPAKHMVAVTSNTSPLASSDDFLDSFYIDDYIGGRYSSTSAVGAVILSIAFGYSVFEQLLEGAHEADILALQKDITKNGALFDALMGIYLRNVLNLPWTAILPYSQALSRFPAHLQQLDMESNGKQVNRLGQPVSYSTGPVLFGEPGTNGQHSFYQLLHQGTDTVPLQFIGFRQAQRKQDLLIDGSTSQEKLNANLIAQIVAFARGKDDANANRKFPGNRFSSVIIGDRLTPHTLGALLAHYENKVMFQGFIWNINSFDQEGVQLGKVLAKQVLDGGSGDLALEAYLHLFTR
jgi:glucose-6-phosphate isomerase